MEQIERQKKGKRLSDDELIWIIEMTFGLFLINMLCNGLMFISSNTFAGLIGTAFNLLFLIGVYTR